jgi:hypothetical protein
MLKGNLSTRPFYNDRLVNLVVGVVAVAVVLLTAYNAMRLVALSGRRSAAAGKIETQRGETERIAAATSQLVSAADRATLTRLAGATREANRLIEERTFSWISLFGVLETTMPIDVRLVSVTPEFEDDTLTIAMRVVARDLDYVDEFLDALHSTGAFYDVAPTEQQALDTGGFTARVVASYRPPDPDRPAAVTVKEDGR